MERNGNAKILAVIALVVAVIGLSVGFAAYSTSLQISSVADVTANNNWNVGFSTDGTNIVTYGNTETVDGKDENSENDGIVDVTKYTIGQSSGHNATLTTTTGSEVTYTLDIVNAGTLTAYSDSLTFASNPVTCANAASSTNNGVIEGTASAGTSSTGGNTTEISQADCEAMFGVSLSIGGTVYTPTNQSTFSSTINPNGASTPAILRIWYKGDSGATTAAAKLDGDITVTVGTITVVYKSNNS